MPPKLVRPQTFDSLQSPDSASPAVRLEKSNLTVLLKDFTLTSFLRKLLMGETPKTALSRFPVSNLISSVFLVLMQKFGFRFHNPSVQWLRPLVYKDFVSIL